MTPSVLLVLPDFFPGGGQAVPYAASLAEALQARLVLLHLRQDALRTPEEHPGLHAHRRELDALSRLQALAHQQYVPTEVVTIEEFLPDAVGDIVRQHQPLALVLAGPSAVPLEILTSAALDLLRHGRCPLLVLPPGDAPSLAPLHLVLAVDGQDFRLPETPRLVPELLARPGARLDIMYVTNQKDPGAEVGHRVVQSVRRSGLAPVPKGTFPRIIYHPDTAAGILHGAAAEKADLLVVVARHHSLLGTLFHRSITSKLIEAQALPLLLLPALD